jgi:hypothetical protein
MKQRLVLGSIVVVLLSIGFIFTSVGEMKTVSTDITIEIEWKRTYGGPDQESASKVISTSDGGFALASGTTSWGVGDKDFWLIKTNATGHAEWNKTYGSVEFDYAGGITETSDGGYALFGVTGSTNYDFLLVKTDDTGAQEWNFTFGTPDSWSTPVSLVQTTDGGFVIAGLRGEDVWLVKADINGQYVWNRTFRGHIPNVMIQTLDGGFFMVGGHGEHPNENFFLLKIDTNGTQEWNSSFSSTGSYSTFDVATSVIQLADGSFILTGVSGPVWNTDYWLLKTDVNGQEVWNVTFGGSPNEEPTSLIQTTDGGFLLTGHREVSSTRDAWWVKTDANGKEEWNVTLGAYLDDNPSPVIQTGDGGFVVAGGDEYFQVGNTDAWLVKLRMSEGSTTSPTTISNTTRGTAGFELGVLALSLIMFIYFSRKRRQ